MTSQMMDRDERSVAVENASYRWGYLFTSFAMLLSIAYRSFVLKQSSWDLLAIVVLGGAVTTIYQRNERILGSRWAILTVIAVALALSLAAVIAQGGR